MNERIQSALLELEKPSRFFEAMDGEQRDQLRELFALIGVPQNPKYHPEGDAFIHSMLVVDAAAEWRAYAKRPLDFMLAALTHDLGKAVATGQKENGDWHSIGHEVKGVPLVRAMLKRIGAENDTIDYCANLCRLHMRMHTCFYGKAGVKATNRLFDECVCPEDLGLLCVCDSRGKGRPAGSSAEEEAYIAERIQLYYSKEAKE